MLYYAYGSNMDWNQMRRRCPSARFVGIALLQDHKLEFTRKSQQRGCGVADVVPITGQNVWGVVYEISDLDVGKLDASEGYRPGSNKNSYWRHERMVSLDGDPKRPLTVQLYIAEREDAPPKPNNKYKDQILSGAKHWHLPAKYIQELMQIEVDT